MDTACTLRGGGCGQHFEKGSMYWAAATGARVVTGAVRTRYAALKAQNSGLGYPTADTVCGLRGGGCAQHFQGGSIYYSPPTGARVHRRSGPNPLCRRRGQNSGLGYPTTDTVCGLRGGGCAQHFQGGSIYYSPPTGARVIAGAVRTRYVAVRGQNSGLGYPTTDTVCGLRGSGCAQHFQGGSIYYSPRTGARVVAGAIRARYLAVGAHNSRLGLPDQ